MYYFNVQILFYLIFLPPLDELIAGAGSFPAHLEQVDFGSILRSVLTEQVYMLLIGAVTLRYQPLRVLCVCVCVTN